MSREWHVELGTRETFGMFAQLRVPDSESELRCRDELGRRRRSRALNEIVKLLLKSGANPNIQNKDKNTALILASRYNRIENVRLLLENSADPNIKNKENKTALTYASNNRHTEIVNLLKQAGAIII